MTQSEQQDAAIKTAGVEVPPRPGLGWMFAGLLLLFALCLPMTAAQAQLPGLSLFKGAAPEAPAETDASYAALADLLENEAARAKLIEQLRGLTSESEAAGTPAPTAPAATPERAAAAGLSERVAHETQRFVDSLAASALTAVLALRDLFTGNVERVISLPDWPTALAHLLAVILATVLAFLVLRAFAARLYRRMDDWVVKQVDRIKAVGAAQEPPPPPPGVMGPTPRQPVSLGLQLNIIYSYALVIVGSLVVDVAAIMLAAGVGYAVALFVVGSSGELGVFEALFVNAFVVVEVGKALVRMVFARRYRNLRLVHMADDLAHYWNDRLERLVAIGGYGVLLAAPALTTLMLPAVGRLFGLIVMLAVYWYAVRMVWKNRLWVRTRISGQAERSTAFFGTMLRMLARTWHWLAIAYFTVMLVVSQVDPVGAMPYMAYGTLQSVLAIGIGLLLSAALTTVLSRPLRLPAELTRRLPMLEVRLNAYIPAVLRGIRLTILVIVILFVLDAWKVFSLSAWVTSDSGGTTIATAVRVAIVLLAATAAWTLVASTIEHRLSMEGGREPSPRERTLLALFRNATLVLIVTMTLLIVLSQIGINIGPLVAGAGVVGLAIGFGAQKLVQDVINGVFIQLENGMNQNDVVEVAGVFGTVEKITIRSVGIRTLDGGYHIIPFSSVDKLANHMRDFSYHLGEYTVAYRESVDDAAYYLERAFDELMTDPVLAPEVLEDMTIAGVTSLNERGFTIRVLIKTKPGMQWAVQRGFNRLVKKHFNAAGIELPYPHTVVYFGQDRNGEAPPIRVRDINDAGVAGAGPAQPAGHTRRELGAQRSYGASTDVLGNELATVVDEDGNVTNNPGTTSTRDAVQEQDEDSPRR